MNKLEMRLIDDWRNFWKFWSVRLGVIGSVLTTALIAFPDLALQVWAIMPSDMKEFLPPKFVPMLGVAVFSLSMLARIIKQKGLNSDNSNGTKP